MNIVLHLGLPKVASTSLQDKIFSKNDEINYAFSNCKTYKDIEEHILYKYVKNFHKKLNKNHIGEIYDKFILKDKINIISSENFYCDMFSKVDDRFVLLSRVNQFFPKAKVIIGIREKKSMLLSWYKQYVAVGGVMNFDNFIKHVLNLEKLNYEDYLDRVVDLYGQKNVFIFDLKDLKEDQQKTVNKICKFIGCRTPEFNKKPINIGYKKKSLKIASFLNKFFKTKYNKIGIPYQQSFILLPHRYILQSRIINNLDESVLLEDLIKDEKSKEIIDNILMN